MIRVAEAVRRLFDKLGDRSNKNRARLRYVFERLGVDAVREEFAQQLAAVKQDGVPEWSGESVPNDERSEGRHGPPATEVVDGVRCFSQRQEGFVAVPLHLPFGFVSADDFARIGDVARRFSAEDGFRTTRRQNSIHVPRKKSAFHSVGASSPRRENTASIASFRSIPVRPSGVRTGTTRRISSREQPSMYSMAQYGIPRSSPTV